MPFMSVNVRKGQSTSEKAGELPLSPTEADWEALIKQATIERADRSPIDWSSTRIKHNWTQGLEQAIWTDADWRLLPSLRKHEHTGGYGGPLQRIELSRCQHGMYLTIDPHPELDYEDNVVEWKAPYCHCCFPEWVVYFTHQELKKGYRFIRTRRMETGERLQLKDKLLDGRMVYPETFTRVIKLRNRSLTDDLRLQEDPETGKPRLETMGGYVGKAFGYGKAGRGHGADSDADDIRMSWLAGSEDSPVGHDDEEEFSHEDWTATLPSVHPPCLNRQKPTLAIDVKAERKREELITELERTNAPVRFVDGIRKISVTNPVADHPDWYSFWGWQGITKENWEPYSFPVWRGGAIVPTNPITGFGLKESEFFGDERLNSMDPETMRNLISWGRNKRHQQWWHKKEQGEKDRIPSFLEERIHNPQYLWADRLKPDSCRAVSFITSYVPLREEKWIRVWRTDPKDKPYVSLIYPMEQEPRQEYPNLNNWYSPIEWVMRNGVTRARFTTATMGNLDTKVTSLPSIFPTARHFAQWKRKPEYQRGGGVHRIPRRRTPAWADDWRQEQRVRVSKPGRGPVKKVQGKQVYSTNQAQEMLATKLDMYRWGVVNQDPTQEQLPDIPAKVTYRDGNGTTKEIQVEKMCATAYENYRQARLALATNHGKAGFWRTERLGGNERGTALGNQGCGWGGKAPQITAGNYGHRLEDGFWPDVECTKPACLFVHDHSEIRRPAHSSGQGLPSRIQRPVVHSRCAQASRVPE